MQLNTYGDWKAMLMPYFSLPMLFQGNSIVQLHSTTTISDGYRTIEAKGSATGIYFCVFLTATYLIGIYASKTPFYAGTAYNTMKPPESVDDSEMKYIDALYEHNEKPAYVYSIYTPCDTLITKQLTNTPIDNIGFDFHKFIGWLMLYKGLYTVEWNGDLGNELHVYEGGWKSHNKGYIWNGSAFETAWTKNE